MSMTELYIPRLVFAYQGKGCAYAEKNGRKDSNTSDNPPFARLAGFGTTLSGRRHRAKWLLLL